MAAGRRARRPRHADPHRMPAVAAVVEVEGDGPLSAGQHLTVLGVVDLTDERGRSQVLDQLASGRAVVLDGEMTAGAREQVSDLIATLVPPLSAVIGRAAVLQAHRNAAARTALAEEFGLLTAREVASLSGSKATNTSATANRWRTNGDVFAVSWEGATVYPGFQFDADGRPRPVLRAALTAIGGAVQGWSLALWFTGADGWLDGARPIDLLDAAPQDVIEAARHLAAPLPT